MKESEVGIRQFYIANRLHDALRETRKEPGIPLKKVASMMATVFSDEELEAIIKHLADKKAKKSLWTRIKVTTLMLF